MCLKFVECASRNCRKVKRTKVCIFGGMFSGHKLHLSH